MATINVSDQLATLGGEISGMNSNFDNILKSIDNLVNQIASVWDGLGHQGFVDDYTSQKDALGMLPEIVANLGKAVTEVANTWSEVDSQLGQR